MKVKTLIKLLSMLQNVEIYAECDPHYPGEFMFNEDIREDKPIYMGEIRNLPYYLLECKIVDTDLGGESPIDVRIYENENMRYPILVFTVIEPEGEYW